MSAADRAAAHDLLVGYFRGFDERRTDDAFLRQTFTTDAHWPFPRGDATGIEEIIERRRGLSICDRVGCTVTTDWRGDGQADLCGDRFA